MRRQSAARITDRRIREIFERKNFAFLSSLMKDGSPHVTPTWVDIEDDNILINTALGRIKQMNITRDPRIALSIIDQDNQYEMVTVRGKVTEQITGDVAEKHIDKLARKYTDMDKYPRRSEGEQRVILKIKPEKIFHMK
ncbi:MAG TPA: PPOX class F420-dependent oxidoreductase [Nitrososphaeraceae archaeon]|jgi:PPOX class probable F420-dependent enzyme|nr:PPOX class F420-dependent oxidoreductase [Nitrososphaeraceae archaeon]